MLSLDRRRLLSLWWFLALAACSSDDDRAAGDDGEDAAVSAPPERMDAGVDAAAPARDASTARDAALALVDAAQRDAGGDAAADAGLVFKPSFGACPAPLSCDPFIYFIANELIRREFSDAPANVSACIQPNLPIPAVPACYEPGPCSISGEVGLCLGMEEPHPNTGYCLKPCT